MCAVKVNHRQSLDLGRFIAAFGVVVAHVLASPRDWVGHLSLGLFLILTGFLAVQSALRAGGAYPWIARARRLALPWLFWAVVYRVIDMRVSDAPERFELLSDPWTLLIGPSIHLWFLPFVMLATVLVAPACHWIKTPRALAVASVGLVVIGLPLFYIHKAGHLPEPLPQWCFALPIYGYGLLIGLGHRLEKPVYPFAAIVVLTVLIYLLIGEPWALQCLVAAVAFEVFWRVPMRHRLLPAMGKAAFGIYLMHPFFLLVLHKFTAADLGVWTSILAAFLMSWAATAVALRVPYLRRMV